MTITIPITRKDLEAARKRLDFDGTPLTGDAGTVEVRGVRLSYSYADEVLTINITKKPSLISDRVIRGVVEGWFRK